MINFSFESGKYRRLGFPKGDSPTTYGVNPAGTILVGQFSASGITEGFLYQNRALQSLLFPESTLTAAYSINDGGEIVGAFVDSNNKGHGFTWTPPADAEKK
jgi:probable HAF family extracellular repeat protein